MNAVTEFTKVQGERERIEALLAKEESKIKRAFRRYLDDVQSEEVLRRVRLALENEGTEAALRIVDSYIARLGSVVTDVFQDAAEDQVEALIEGAEDFSPEILVTFDPTRPRAAELMRQNKFEFVQGFTGAQRATTREALVEAFLTGAGPIETARAFRNSIGLTKAQQKAVANYRRLLEAADSAALNRTLRDRRFDSAVRRAIEDGEPLGADRIDNMVNRYRNRMLQLRAETIARTEALRSVGLARHEALQQFLEQTGIPPDSVVRIWQSMGDKRVRDTHDNEGGMDGQERGVREPFQSPSGARLMFPGDPTAPASEVINCRCTVLHEFRKTGKAA